MASGYVYVMTNPSMPGLLKIGNTSDTRFRAKKLYTTGVPTPFEIAFEIFSNDVRTLEGAMHSRLASFRVNTDREFFRYPLNQVIDLLLDLAGSSSKPDSSFSALSILARLKELYPRWIDPKIADVQVVQTNERVWLEITKEEVIAGYLRNQAITRTDLGFIAGDKDGSTYFRPDLAVTHNARKFTEEFDAYSIVMTTDLFHDEGCKEVATKHSPYSDRLEPSA